MKKYLSKFKNLLLSHKKTSILIIVILLILGYLIFPKSSKPILTQTVTRGDVIRTVSVTGNIAADRVANLTFQTPEKLAYVGVKLWDSVKKGQLIASLDQTILQASFRQAQQDFIAAKAASQQYYDNHTNSTESDQEKVERTAIDDAQNKAYDQMLKVEQDLYYSTLYSPIDGIVTRMDAQTAGVNITPLTTFTIIDPNSLNFNMDVDEADIGNVKQGQDVDITLDAFPNTTLKLKVTSIDFVSHQTSSGGTAFAVKAALAFNQSYRVGMSGNADIVTGVKRDVLNIPLASIMDDNTVYVENNRGYFVKTKVETGIQSDTLTEITSGLSEGEIIALDPSSVPSQKIRAR